jgi:hypothetical protein
VKNKKTIEKLQLDTTRVEFPSPNRWQFGQYSGELRGVVIENLVEFVHTVGSIQTTWAWSPEQQDFAFDVIDEVKVWTSGRWVYTACTAAFTLDPRKSIVAEIERLIAEITAWRNALGDLYKLQLKNIKDTQGVDAMITAAEAR